MKQFILVNLIFLLGGQLFAQHSAESKKILDRFAANYKDAPSITADFSFTLENKEEGIDEVNDGKIAIKKSAYKLDMMGMEIYSDGTNSYTYMPDAMEVNISSLEDSEDEALNPATIFSIYEEGFTSTFTGEESVNGKTVQVIKLIPTDTTRDFTSVLLYINKVTGHLVKAVTNGKDGNDYIIQIKTMNTQKDYNDEYFVFDTTKYPDVDVIDMR